MSIADRLRAAWRLLGEWGEAVEYDPVEDLHRRVSRLERQVEMDVLPHQHPDPEPTSRDAVSLGSS